MISAYIKLHGDRAEAARALPAASSVGLHQLGGGGVISTDNASAALAARRAISELVEAAVKEHIGDEEWTKMTADEQSHATLTYGANCFRHLPNTWISGGEKAETVWLKESIGATIDALDMTDVEKEKARLNPGMAGVVRAAAKEFGTGQDVYAKGEGLKVFKPWVEEHMVHKSRLIMRIERAEKGSRFDIATKAGFALYWNRPVLCEFLSTQPLGDVMILKDYLYAMLGCLENIACLRCRGIVHDKFTEPMLFFGASEELDGWSVLDMAPVTDMVRAALELGADDGTTWMKLEFDIFEDLDTGIDEYQQFKSDRLKLRRRSADKSKWYFYVSEVQSELYEPTDATNKQTDVLTAAALEVWCKGMLATLKGGEGAKYLTGGEYGIDNQTEAMKRHFRHTYRNTDRPCESYFGILKYNLSLFTNMSVDCADAMAMAQRNHLFGHIAHTLVPRRKKLRARSNTNTHKTVKKAKGPKDQPVVGRLEKRAESGTLSALMLASRRGVSSSKQHIKEGKAEAHRHNLKRRAAHIEKKLKQQEDAYIAAQKAFSTVERIPNVPALDTQLGLLATTKAKASCVKKQIKLVVDGYGLRQFKTQYSSSKPDSEIGEEGSAKNYEYLYRALVRIWAKIESEGISIPSEAAVPLLKRRHIPHIGTLTTQRELLDKTEHRTADEVKQNTLNRVFEPKDTAQAGSTKKAPAIDEQLEGKKVMFLFDMTYDMVNEETGEEYEETGLFECPGVIEKVREHKQKKPIKHKGQTLQMGFAYITWAKDNEWSTQLLRAGYYGQRRAGGWRIPADDEDLTLERDARARDAMSDNDDESAGSIARAESSSDDDL